MSRNLAHDAERVHYTLLATNDADETYRARLLPLYDCWRRWNTTYFAGRLLEPHLGFGPTHPRMVGYCEPTTHYGARVQLTLNASLVFGTNRRWVVNPWPAAGTRLFLEDLLLRLTVRHYVLEVLEAQERTYDGFGPLFAAEANRLGGSLELAPVVARNRKGANSLLAKFWPHNVWLVQDPRRYGDDVTEELLALATGAGDDPNPKAVPGLGTWELVRLYLADGRADRLRQIASAHLARLRVLRGVPRPGRRHCSAGSPDTAGAARREVVFDPDWLTWDNGLVRTVVTAFVEARAFAEVPLLADLLEDAGCTDDRILEHLRQQEPHAPDCWVLQGLLAAGQPAS